MKILSVICCIRKILKSDYYLHHFYAIGMTQISLDVFSWIFCKMGWKYCFINVGQK